MSRRTRSATHNAWTRMRANCGYIRSATPQQRSYYAGIAVCREWRDSYPAFERWALAHGHCAGKAVVRVDKRGGYCPENCVVVSKAQANDMRSCVRRLADGRTARTVVGSNASRRKQGRTAFRMFVSNWDPESAASVPALDQHTIGRISNLLRNKERIVG